MDYRHYCESKGGRFSDREQAREVLNRKVADMERQVAGEGFSSYNPRVILRDAEFRLRWIDCAPEGANHLIAILQGDYGVPMGGTGRTIGAGSMLMNPAYRRIVREKMGECPIERARRIFEAGREAVA